MRVGAALSDDTARRLVRLSQAQLDEAVQRHGLFREGRSGGRRAVLVAHDLSSLGLAGADLSHADFTGSSFFGADLRGARFEAATLFACDFRQANLESASLAHADLRGCFFAGAIMLGANLFEADLRPGAHVARDKTGEFRA